MGPMRSRLRMGRSLCTRLVLTSSPLRRTGTAPTRQCLHWRVHLRYLRGNTALHMVAPRPPGRVAPVVTSLSLVVHDTTPLPAIPARASPTRTLGVESGQRRLPDGSVLRHRWAQGAAGRRTTHVGLHSQSLPPTSFSTLHLHLPLSPPTFQRPLMYWTPVGRARVPKWFSHKAILSCLAKGWWQVLTPRLRTS